MPSQYFLANAYEQGPEPVPASEVNIVGKISGDAAVLKKAKGTNSIRIEKA